MRLFDLIKTGWTEIWAHKMRSFLSFFAVAIGIATFFYTLSVLSQRYRDLDKTAQISGTGRIDTKIEHILSLDQYKYLKSNLPPGSSLSIITDGQYIGGWVSVSYHNQEFTAAEILGIMPTWKDSAFAYKLEGRFINQQDIENKNRVALIMVFPHEKTSKRGRITFRSNRDTSNYIDMQDFTVNHNLLNQPLVIHNETFKVVGLLHAPPELEDFRLNQDKEHFSHILIPYTTFYSLFPSEDGRRDTYIRIVTGKESTARVASKSLSGFLRAQFGPKEKPNIEFFYDKLQRELANARKSLNNMLFMGIIAMIAGGIGIMNVTMAVIFSRTKEIGIRRALGASRRDILFQFLVEAMLLGFLGSCAGMVLGYIAVLYMAQNVKQMTFAWWVVALSILIALITSFLFALYPAWQAAKLKPVDALRSE